MARVVFMGSPQFAVPSLVRLIESEQVVGVVTQPDRRAGRGAKVCSPDVKLAAEQRGLEIIQPETLGASEVQETLRGWAPDVIVVAAFGQLLPVSVLELPPHGCLNVHASLLPRWRGASPVAAAIRAGDEVTGATVMRMDEGLDTGPIVATREELIRPDDTTGALTERLAELGAELLVEALPAYLAGELVPQPQPDEGVTYCDRMVKEDGRLDWSRSALDLDRQVRAVSPWPGAFTSWEGRRMKVLSVAPLPDWEGPQAVGTVVPVEDGAAVVCGEGALMLLEVQLAGKRALPIDVFLCGQQECIGAELGA